MEYYELSKLDETVPSKKQNPFAPKLPFRLGVAGTSESGKTKMVVRLLLGSKYPKIYPWMSGEKHGHKIPKGGSKNFGERYIPCDDLIVVAQHQDEELWETVQCFYEFIAKNKQAPWYENVRFKLIVPEELPDISSFKRTGRSTAIVFDDLAGEPLTTQLKSFLSLGQAGMKELAQFISPSVFMKSIRIYVEILHIFHCIVDAEH